MKKLIAILGSIGLGVTPISTVVSCFGPPKENVKEKIELTEDSLKEWISTKKFGYQGDFYFIDGNETDKYAFVSIFSIFVYKIQNVIAEELNKTFKSSEWNLWDVYVWANWSENEDIINEQNGFKSQKNYEIKYELTFRNKHPKNKMELKFKDLVFNFKQENKVSFEKFERKNLNYVIENYGDYKNDLFNPFNWGGKGNLFNEAKEEIILGNLSKAKELIQEYINKKSMGIINVEDLPFKSLYFTSVINEIHPYEKIEGSDKIKFKISATSTFVNLDGKPTIDWEAIYII